MSKHVVGTVAEIPPGARKIVEIEGRTIGVFNINGEFFAVRNTCPHQGGPLCEGALTGLRQARVPGEYTYTRKGEILRCPWHGWEFDIRTGQSWWNPERVRTRAYRVSVEAVAGEMTDELPDEASHDCDHAAPADASSNVASGPQPGPYRAETYPVTVEAAQQEAAPHAAEQRAGQQVVVVEVP